MKKMTSHSIKRFLLDIVYPNKCPFCGEPIAFDKYYCCFGGLELSQRQNTDTIALFDYSEAVVPFVYAIKDRVDGYAVSAAAKLLCERIPDGIDLVTCIPADCVRVRKRGYNPPALIAREVAALAKPAEFGGLACDTKLLVKTRRTQEQKSLSELERRENVKGAFALRKSGAFVPKTVLLIDDVRTTGATLAEATRVLRAAGAERVYTAVVADTVFKNLYSITQ
jgi:competence protein ComFC